MRMVSWAAAVLRLISVMVAWGASERDFGGGIVRGAWEVRSCARTADEKVLG